MKDLLIVANWKSNKTTNEARDWLNEFKISDINLDNKKIILCPPFTLLGFLKKEIAMKGLPVKLGAQNISEFESGPYTGEVNAVQIREFSEYVIIGHSERRKNFGDNENIISKKAHNAIGYNLLPIFCVSNVSMNIPKGVDIVAYEPLFAIGTGNSDTPENANEVAKKIKENNNEVKYVLYGGSVTPGNVSSFTRMKNISGVLVGGESLDALSFLQIVQNA